MNWWALVAPGFFLAVVVVILAACAWIDYIFKQRNGFPDK